MDGWTAMQSALIYKELLKGKPFPKLTSRICWKAPFSAVLFSAKISAPHIKRNSLGLMFKRDLFLIAEKKGALVTILAN